MPGILIDIIRSFHDNMNASIRVDGELLEEIEVYIGLRQGCSMASTLLNLYACVVGEGWLSRVAEMEDVGAILDTSLISNSLGDTPEMQVKIPQRVSACRRCSLVSHHLGRS